MSSSHKRRNVYLVVGIKHEKKGDFRNTKELKHIFCLVLAKDQMEPIQYIGIDRNNIVMLIVTKWLLTILHHRRPKDRQPLITDTINSERVSQITRLTWVSLNGNISES